VQHKHAVLRNLYQLGEICKIFLYVDNRCSVIAKHAKQIGQFDVNRRRLQARLVEWINDDSLRGKSLTDTFVGQDHNEAHYLTAFSSD
jgi:hypothetical protein